MHVDFRVSLLCLLSVLASALLVFAASVGWDRVPGVSWAEWGTWSAASSQRMGWGEQVPFGGLMVVLSPREGGALHFRHGGGPYFRGADYVPQTMLMAQLTLEKASEVFVLCQPEQHV